MQAAPMDIPLARKLLEADGKLPQAQRRFNRANILHAIADIDLAQANKIALTGTEPIPDGLRAYMLVKNAVKDPANAELSSLNLLHDPLCKLYAAVEVGMAVAKTDPGLSEQLYHIAKPIFDGTTHNCTERKTIEGLGTFADVSLRTIALAGVLQQHADVDAMLDSVMAQVERGNDAGQGPLGDELFATAGRVSPEFVVSVYRHLDDPLSSIHLGNAITATAPHDPDTALRLYNALQQLLARGDGEIIGLGDLSPVIMATGKADPAAALALAKLQPDYQQPAALLVAAACQPKSSADAIMQDLFADKSNRTIMNLAKANAIDPDVAKELYANYRQEFDAESYHFTHPGIDFPFLDGRVKYAYLISSFDPVEARLILETEYSDDFSNTRHGRGSWERQAIPLAISLDVDRAQKMLEALKDPDHYLQFMHYILMPRAERVSAPLF